MENQKQIKSTVYITGAGPGDPNLLTLKAKEIIEKADVIAYDNLVSKEILESIVGAYCGKPLLIYVGKTDGKESISQEQINNLLLKLSNEYKIVCRLKGGDPNIFGRGGEEAIFLKENNINFEIIPGVSSITAVPAYAGIPLTHRDCNSSFTVITAHEDPDDPESKVRWDSFDAVNSTLILLMGVKNLPKIINKLISLGRDKNTPLAVIYWGTTSKQFTVKTTIENAVKDLEKNPVKAPSVIIIGEVVNYREALNWFESKPLFRKRILITRSKEQSFSFASKLIKAGAEPIICPIVNYQLTEKEVYNKDIINNISKFDWIFFTSQNAVRFFFETLKRNCYDSRALAGVQIAAVGYKTKHELEKYNIKADFIPKKFSLEDLVNELGERINLNDKKILHPTQVGAIHAALGEPRLWQELPLLQVTTWNIYKANFINELDQEIISQLKKGIDIVTFFSSNTVKHFAELVKQYDLLGAHCLPLTATIGDETATTVKQIYGRVDIIAEPYTEDGLIHSMENYFYGKLNLKIQTQTVT